MKEEEFRTKESLQIDTTLSERIFSAFCDKETIKINGADLTSEKVADVLNAVSDDRARLFIAGDVLAHQKGSGDEKNLRKQLCTIYDAEFDIFAIDNEKGSIIKIDLDHFSHFPQRLLMMHFLCTKRGTVPFVVFISHSGEKSGAERSLLELIRELTASGVLCHLLLPESAGELKGDINELPISHSVLSYRWWAVWTETRKKVIEDVVKNSVDVVGEIGRINPDLIYTNTSVINVGAIAAQELNVPHIWHVREYGTKDHNLQFILDEKMRAQYIDRYSDRAIFNSHSIKDYYTNYANFSTSSVVYNNVSVKDIASDGEKYFHNADALKLVVVGNICHAKGQLDAVDAVKELIREGKKVELLIIGGVGDAKYGDKIKKIVAESDLRENIRLTGFVDNASAIIAEADIVIVPSHMEAFGRVAVEGMLLEKPIIGARSGGTAELITDGVNGLLYDVGDSDDLKRKIKTLLREPEKGIEMGRHGLAFTQRTFSLERYSGEIHTIIEALVNDHKKYFHNIFSWERNNIILKVNAREKDLKTSKVFLLRNLFVRLVRRSYNLISQKCNGSQITKSIGKLFKSYGVSLQKLKYLWESFWLIISREGVKSVLLRIYYYARYGKGVTTQKDFDAYQESEKSAPPLALTKTIAIVRTSDEVQMQGDKVPIDVIVPVYNGFDYLEPLFTSLLRNKSVVNQIIVVDDQSTDEKVYPLLEKFAHSDAGKNIRLIQNEENIGFIRTVNKAVALTKNHFVILNTDTEVPDGWLERLMAPIVSQKDIASVTPFTNAGTIFSFPETLKDNDLFDGMNVNELDQYMQKIGNAHTVTVPTGMGFCMGFNKDVVAQIGMFDAQTFGRGYGEENDWSQRAIKAGYSNVAVPSVFVYHKHGASFPRKVKQDLIQKNLVKLNAKHTGYDKRVQEYIMRDPLRKYRDLLLMMILRDSGNAPALTMMVDHELGGGTSIYRNRFIKEKLAADESVVVFSYEMRSSTYYSRYYSNDYYLSYKFESEREFDWLLQFLQIKKIILSQNVSFPQPLETLAYLQEIAQEKNCPIEFLVHDFFAVCPSFNLLNEKGAYCKVPDNLDVCRRCLLLNKGNFRLYNKEADIDLWRSTWKKFLLSVDQITCFSRSSQEILLRAYPDLEREDIAVIPHTSPAMIPIDRDKKKDMDPLIIGVLGGINYMKGAEIVIAMAKMMKKEKVNAKIIIIGEIDKKFRNNKLFVHGRYKHNEIGKLVRKYKIDVFLIPSIWPETFSYTAEEVMQMQLPLAVFDLGAPAERVKKYEKGMIIPKMTARSALDTLTDTDTDSNQ